MNRLLVVLLVMGTAQALVAQSDEPKAEPELHPAEAESVIDIPLPTLCVTPWAFIVLDAVITAEGKPQDIEVRRGVDCLTSLAVQGVQAWKFTPAMLGDKPVASRLPIVVTFRPPSPYSDPVPLPALKPQSDAAIQAEFQPAELLHAVFPPYRYQGYANTAGTVVLQVGLDAKGEAKEIKVLRELTPFTDEAKDIVADWRFMPATLNGRPIPSTILLAFVSPLPPASGPIPVPGQ